MGTKSKTPQEQFEQRIKKDKSVEKQVYVILKPKKSWENGLSFKKLKREVEVYLKKSFCDGRIYTAISLINRFGKPWDMYVRSECKRNDEGDNEYRYYVPTENYDIQREKRDLDHKKHNIELKEDHLEYHEKVTLPQEQKLAEIQR